MARTRYSEFKALVRRFCGALGLGDWRVDFDHLPLADRKIIAETRLIPDQRSAKFVLNRAHVPGGEKGWDLEDTALHEVLHVAFSEMLAAAASSHSDRGKRVETLEHGLINRLCEALLKRKARTGTP